MFRDNLLFFLGLMALALTVVPVCGQNEITQTADQNAKSVMRKIYEEDQKNRNDEAGDTRRREQVRQLISQGKVQTGEDYYYAAFIFQLGRKPSDYLYAHVLAVTAVNKGLHNGMWLSAATMDRYLHSIRQPQVFGTQFGNLYTHRDDQEPYDRKLLSDALRSESCVVTLEAQAEILSDKRAGKKLRSTRTCPLPDAQFDAN